jgi:hypothetical protein
MGRGGRGATSKYGKGRGRRDDYDDYDDEEPYYAAKKSGNLPLIIALSVVGAIIVIGGGIFIAGGDTRDLENTVYELFDAVNSGKGDRAIRLVNDDELVSLRQREKDYLARNPSMLTKGLTGSPTVLSIDRSAGDGNRRWVKVQASGGTKNLQFAKLGGAWFVCITSNMKNKLISATSQNTYEVGRQGDTWGQGPSQPQGTGGYDPWGNDSGQSSPPDRREESEDPLDRRGDW